MRDTIQHDGMPERISLSVAVGKFRSCFCIAKQSFPSAWIIEGRLPNGENLQLAN